MIQQFFAATIHIFYSCRFTYNGAAISGGRACIQWRRGTCGHAEGGFVWREAVRIGSAFENA